MEFTNHCTLSATDIKTAARGRWDEILSSVGGIAREVLDGKHHPCPKCGGTDRFRYIDAEDGACFCNQCFNHANGDGLAALRWLLGITFREACARVAKYLGIDRGGSGNAVSKPQPKPASPANAVIVAEYNYRDQDGSLLSQVVRYDPKGFRQRKPKADGGWDWSVEGMRRVPYRLPELDAKPSQTVFIVEGEKDVDNLAAIGIVATCNACGAGNWTPDHAAYLHGRHVVVLPDNDDVGRKHAERVAKSLQGIAASVKVVELPNLSEKGDVSDWLDSHEAAEPEDLVNQLQKMVDVAPEWKPSVEGDSLPKWSEFQAFPLDLIPRPIRAYVDGAAEAIGTDPSFIALPMLAALGSAIGNTRRIALKSSWTEPPIVWGGIVGDSGTLKTPSLSAAIERMEYIQNKYFVEHQEAMEAFNAEQRNRQDNSESWKNTNGLRGEGPQAPVMRRVVVSDVTVEALAQRLQDSPRGLLLVRDELAGWLQSFNQYKGGGGGDVAHWLSMYNAKPLWIDRKTGSPTTFVQSAAVSICGGIQPETLRRCLSSEHWENGLAARLLLANPPKRPRKWTEHSISETSKRAVADIFDRLLALDFGSDDDGNHRPVVLPLNEQAKSAWVNFYNRHGSQQAELTGREAALWSKLEGTAPRLALILHCVRVAAGDADESAIDETSMAAGIGLAEWFGAEATRIYGMLSETDQQRAQRRLAELIQRKGGTITARECNQSCRWLKDTEAAESALNELAKAGLGEWQGAETSPKGGRPTREFRLSTPSTVYETQPKPQETAGFVDVDNVDDGFLPRTHAPFGADQSHV